MSELKHFFALKKEPFPQDIPVKEIFMLPGLPPLEKRIQFMLNLRSISLITGEVGSGKSTSLRYVCSKLHPARYKILHIVGGRYGMMEFLRSILYQFGISIHSYQISHLMKLIREQLLEIVGRKEIPLLVVDEAHLLRNDIFAQLHTMIQLEFDSKPVLPIILCGQDILLDKLMTPDARPLASRIIGRSHLQSINFGTMREYINYHLALAGTKEKLFSDEAIRAVHQGSGGLLRRANNLAKGALLAAAMEQCKIISPDHVRLASTELI